MNIKKLKGYKKILLAYLQLMRVKNCAIASFAIFIAAAMALGEITITTKIILAAGAAFIIMAAGNAFNDYYDYVIDKINRPDRPIPSGKVKRSDAMMLSLTLFMVGIALAYNINLICFAIAAANSVILIIYARYSKKMLLVSNFIVSYLVATIFIFGGLAAVGFVEAKPIFILSGCAFLMTFSREIIKDIEDIKGDKDSGAETLPIYIGAKKAKNIAILFSIVAILLGFMPYIFKLINNPLFYLLLIIIADIIFLYSLTKQPRESQKVMVFGMVLVLVAFFVGSVF